MAPSTTTDIAPAAQKAWRSPVTFKADGEGQFEAVFTTFGVVDKDGDVIDRGAFDDGVRVPVLLAHRSADLPIGAGVLSNRGDEGVITGRFFAETEAGREARATVKALVADGITQELSHGFLIQGSREPTQAERQAGAMRGITRIQPIEVSLVLRGAGENTRVLSVKEEPSEKDLTLEEQYALLRNDLSDFVDRIKGRAVLRQSQGRPLSKASLALLRDFRVDLEAANQGLVDLLAEPSQKHPEYDRLYAQLLRTEAGV